jgi:cation diffusion facilitator CzcD-associated flavoprotein CzcO
MSIAESTTQANASAPPVRARAVIIGTGFAGLGMAIALQRQGVDFVIVEKAHDVGGTWRDNSYPGCACDVPSHLYSFSFEPKATWSKLFSPQPEILDYLKDVTEKYGLRRYIRFGQKVSRAHWDDSEYRWHVFTESGDEYVAQFLISGAGALHIPRTPDIDGMDEFLGPAFHSAQWDHSVDLTGKRVAIIGTGASAIQIVPELVRRDAGVAEVQLYQRTPPWVVPRPNSLLPDAVRKAFRDGIVTDDGVEHPVDVIVYATGFHTTDSYTYVDVKGPRGEGLVDRWNREGVVAHRGIAVADMPNLFFLLGPNTGLGHTSVVFMIESQIHYVAEAIAAVDKAGAQALAPSRTAQDRSNDELQSKLAGSVWNTGGCSSWYLDEHGVNRTLWSGMTWQYWRETRSLKLAEYKFFGVGTGSSAKGRAVSV